MLSKPKVQVTHKIASPDVAVKFVWDLHKESSSKRDTQQSQQQNQNTKKKHDILLFYM